MKNIEYKEGDKINGITYLWDVEPYKYFVKAVNRNRIGTDRKALFECYCGTRFVAIIRAVRRGKTGSCGGHHAETFTALLTKHGLATPGRIHSVYMRWQGIKERCYNPKSKCYKDYGGRGISLSEEFHDPVVFYDYVISLEGYDRREELNLTIDRINNNGNYERGNLRWATWHVQRTNQRIHDPSPFKRSIVRYYEKFGLPV